MPLTLPPTRMHSPKVVSHITALFGTGTSFVSSSQVPASATGPAVNEAQYYPFVLPERKTYTHGWWFNGSAPDGAANIRMAVYSAAQALLATTADTLKSGASVLQTAAFTAAVTLEADTVYYYSIKCDVGADLNGCIAFPANLQYGQFQGYYRQAIGAAAYPDPATFATWTSQVVPVCGIADMAIV